MISNDAHGKRKVGSVPKAPPRKRGGKKGSLTLGSNAEKKEGSLAAQGGSKAQSRG